MATPTPSRFTCVAVFLIIIAGLAIIRLARAQDQFAPPKATEHHRLLQNAAGTWDATIKLWADPNAEPAQSKGSEKNELLEGGLWLVSRFEGEMMGMKFTGVGTFGYDPDEKKYVGTWIDTMSPHLMTMKGDYDAATRSLVLTGETREPTGEVVTTKQISRHIDDNTRIFEMHVPDKNGKYSKVMEIEYKRRANKTSTD